MQEQKALEPSTAPATSSDTPNLLSTQGSIISIVDPSIRVPSTPDPSATHAMEPDVPKTTDSSRNSQTNNDEQLSRFPEEIHEHIIAFMDKQDLKNARFVSQSWKDFATPHLYRDAVFSSVAENVAQLRKLVDSDMSSHITRLYLDGSSFLRPMTPTQYSQYTSRWFAQLLKIDQPTSGPLCPENLLYVLRSDTSASLTPDHLQGPARAAFAAGYTLYTARVEAQQSWIRADQLFTALDYIIARLPNLKHVETVTGWGKVQDIEWRFRHWLRHNLPGPTSDLIGLGDDDEAYTPELPNAGLFETPGPASRMLHPMAMGPSRGLLPTQNETTPLVIAALRALKGNKIRLDSLKLPGCDCIGERSVPWDRSGMISSSAICAVPMTMFAPTVTPTELYKENLLLPLFKNLKSLELQIDHTHPGIRAFIYDVDTNRLPKAMLAMKHVESLAIGLQTYDRCSMKLYDYAAPDLDSVFFDKSKLDGDGEEAAVDDSPPPPGPPPNLNNIFAGLAQMFGLSPSGSGTLQVPQVSTGQAGSVPVTSSSSTQAPNQAEQPPTSLQPQFSYTVDEMTGNESMSIMLPGEYDDLGSWGITPDPNALTSEKAKQTTTDDPLSPTPWPMLRSLAMWNMPAKKPDLLRLMKTVKHSLKSLTLINVYYDRPAHQAATGGGASPLSMGMLQPQPGMQPGAAGGMQLPTIGGLFAAPSASQVPGTPSPPPNPLATIPEEDNGSLSSGWEATGPGDMATTEDWYDTLDVLSDVLHLDHCEIRLSPEDTEKLRKKLAAQIEGFESTNFTIDQFVTEYVLSGGGVGLAMAVAEAVKLEKDRLGLNS